MYEPLIFKKEIIGGKVYYYLNRAGYYLLSKHHKIYIGSIYIVCDGLRNCEICGTEFPYSYFGCDFHMCQKCRDKLKNFVEDDKNEFVD